jgi:hypothetical protein
MRSQHRQRLRPQNVPRRQALQNGVKRLGGDLPQYAGKFDIGRLQQAVNPIGRAVPVLPTCVRRRVRSRSSRISGGGTKLPRTNPYCSNSAIRAASTRSVLWPGKAFTCCGLSSSSSSFPAPRSSTFHTGCQYTPVLSLAIRVMRLRRSRARNCSRSSVKVENVASTISTCLPFCTIRAHTKTFFSWTSRPAQRRYTSLIVLTASVGATMKSGPSFACSPPRGRGDIPLCRAQLKPCAQARFTHGLQAPTGNRPSLRSR